MRYLLLISALLAAAPSFAAPRLEVSRGSVASYRCADGSRVRAVYYRLSDDSLAFVKLTLDGREFTLPNVISASGSRYSDLAMLEWWTKGSGATLNRDVSAEKPASVECHEVAITP